MKQGRVYFPSMILPPGQQTNHRIIILSNNHIIHRSGYGAFLVCAIIRSAISSSGKFVNLIPGHTIPVHPEDFTVLGKTPVIIHHSLIETHQLFHISTSLLSNQTNRPLGDLSSEKIQAVLAGAKKLFN